VAVLVSRFGGGHRMIVVMAAAEELFRASFSCRMAIRRGSWIPQ